MKEIGSKLREAREKRNLSIQDVSTAIKINVKTLESIEHGDLESLPAKPFLRGFVQTYAKYLDLNVDEIMKQFLEIHGSTKPRPQISEEVAQTEQPDHEEIQKRVELYKRIAYIVTGIVAFVLIYAIHRVVSKYENESKIAKEKKEQVQSQLGGTTESTVPPAETTSSAPANTDEKKPESKIETSKPTDESHAGDVTKTEIKEIKETKDIKDVKDSKDSKDTKKEAPQKIDLKKEETKTETPKVEPKKVTEVKKEVTKPSEATTAPKAPATPLVLNPIKTEPAKAVEKTEKKEETKTDSKKTTPSRPQNIILEALDNVEVRYTKDSDSEKTVRLKPDQVFSLHATSKVSLNISDGGAVNVIQNGRDKGVPGSLGQSIKLNYP